ncbi:MAG: response regulator transcription factor [Balneolaceae bacterium]|nr:response regulator transcription factor [Balneolaceae bacterium]MBO6547947.1 response regulator transcription factor [Balneolaceae bacterium]MBO6648460.1 response regulator transcription factor [Balneolaceae bacterium]
MSDKPSILLVEDEAGLVMTIRDRLEEERYIVEVAEDGAKGYKEASTGNYDLIILDLMLPEKGGLDICRDLRQNGIETPILMLTAKGQVIDKVLGLKLGADDYMQKPFEMMELLARVEVQLRKKKRAQEKSDIGEYSFGDVQLNFKKMLVTKAGDEVTLSAKEFQLLRFLVENEGGILTRDQLLNEVWGYDALPSTRTVDVHIAWLRQKLEEDSRYPRYILTVHGFGYKFVG